MSNEFCKYCGAGVGLFRREGEGTCPECDPSGVQTKVKPTDPRLAFGAQPAEAELTDEDIKKFDLFTQEEIDQFMHWEMQMIRETPYKEVRRIADALREAHREE